MPGPFEAVAPARLLPEWADMQGLVLSAYPHLDRAAYLFYRIDKRELTRAWLAGLWPEITTAFRNAPNYQSQAGKRRNVNIAFTWTGIEQLGIPVSKFSIPFIEGIDGQVHRSRLLGDTGSNRPATWEWGSGRRPVDLLLMVFAHHDDSLEEEIAALAPPAEALTRVWRVDASPLSKMHGREHFGFVDGMSQPILEGSVDAERFPDSIHLTALGEFVLGYPDSFGVCLGATDPTGRLAELPTAEPVSAAVWSSSGLEPVPPALQNQWDEFGRNGSYLVVRQLEQDVDRFWDFVATATGGYQPGTPEAEFLAAKMVGRWRDGTPLVPYATLHDNEFGFAEDPHGYGCPIGSHVRRANPRDTFENNTRSFRPRNDHRILRRGRAYGPPLGEPANGDTRGLMFLCLNTDLERQFEFIQQHWINNPAFGGLADETDPLVSGDAGRRAVFTMGGLPAPHSVRELPPFVTVKGGQYFFLPGMKALRRLAGL